MSRPGSSLPGHPGQSKPRLKPLPDEIPEAQMNVPLRRIYRAGIEMPYIPRTDFKFPPYDACMTRSTPSDSLDTTDFNFLDTESTRLIAAGDFEQAAALWLAAMARSLDREALGRCKLGYCEVLQAQQRFAEASAILQELYETLRQPRFLHQLGQLAQASGDSERARDWLQQEAAALAPNDALAQAQNALAQGRLLLGDAWQPESIQQLRRCILQAKAAQAPGLEGQARSLLGELALHLGDTELARFYYASAYEAQEQAGDTRAMHELATRLEQLP